MKRVMVQNTTNCPIYVGAAMIPAGESRDFPEDQVPAHLRPQEQAPAATAAAPEPTDAEKLAASIAEARSHPVGEIREQFATFSDEYLAALAAAEEDAEKPRKSLLEAIAAEQLQRAEKAGSGG